MMDLIAYEAGDMYFDEPLDSRAEALIKQAGEFYGEPQAEDFLRQAAEIAPEHLTVLVALYRYHFYRHQHGEALSTAEHVLEIVARRLNLSAAWGDVVLDDVMRVVEGEAELVRFYLNALKGAGYLLLRLGNAKHGLERLDKVAELDPKDRIGAAALAAVARESLAREVA